MKHLVPTHAISLALLPFFRLSRIPNRPIPSTPPWPCWAPSSLPKRWWWLAVPPCLLARASWPPRFGCCDAKKPLAAGNSGRNAHARRHTQPPLRALCGVCAHRCSCLPDRGCRRRPQHCCCTPSLIAHPPQPQQPHAQGIHAVDWRTGRADVTDRAAHRRTPPAHTSLTAPVWRPVHQPVRSTAAVRWTVTMRVRRAAAAANRPVRRGASTVVRAVAAVAVRVAWARCISHRAVWAPLQPVQTRSRSNNHNSNRRMPAQGGRR
jgi:hypothetical protein